MYDLLVVDVVVAITAFALWILVMSFAVFGIELQTKQVTNKEKGENENE